MAGGVDPLLDAVAELLADALDLSVVEIELRPSPQVSLRGQARRSAGCRDALSMDELTITAPQGKVRIARAGWLPPETAARARRVAEELARAASRIAPPFGELSVREEMRLLKEQRVLEGLARSRWNVAAAARLLGVTKLFVYRVVRTVRNRGRRQRRA